MWCTNELRYLEVTQDAAFFLFSWTKIAIFAALNRKENGDEGENSVVLH